MSSLCPSRTQAPSGAHAPRWSLNRKDGNGVPARDRLSWEGTATPRAGLWLLAAPLAVLAAVATGLFVRQFGATQVFFAENGPVEILQSVFLAMIGAVFLLAFRRSSDSRAFFCLTVAYAIVFAITREIPRCGSEFFDGGVCMAGGWKTGTVITASVLALAALLTAPIAWRKVMRPSNLRWVWPAAVVAGIIVLAEAAETLIYIEIEESLELTAYAYLGAFGIQILRQMRAQKRSKAGPQMAPAR